MKNIIFILMLFLALQAVYAETEIFSGTLITDTDKEIDGSIFNFKYDDASNKVFVQTPTKALIVDNGACKSNEIFRVCINRANFSYRNITTYLNYYEVDATIYKLTGSLSTGSKSALSTLLQGEPTELTVTLTNPTDFDITNVVFNYDMAPFFVAEAKGCELNGRQMEWKGSLNPKYDKTCTATIIAEREGKYSLSGNLSYFNGLETEKKSTDTFVITVLPKQLKIIQSIDGKIKAENPFYLNISLQNIHPSEEISALAAITIPSHVSLIKDTPSFEKSARVLKQSLTLKPGASINYSLYMEKLSEGKEPINLRFEYTIKGINDVIENSTFVDVISTQPLNETSKPRIKEEKSNDTVNLTAHQDVQASQPISENKTKANLEAGNKTKGQVTVIDVQEHKPSSKNILLLIIAALIAFTIIVLAVFRTRRKRGESDELANRIREKLDASNNEQNKPKDF